MILTLTPNPSVDRTISLDYLVHGTVHRATGTRMDPGGKGLNVSRAVSIHGAATCAVLPLGGPYGKIMADLLAEARCPVATVPISEGIRANIALVEPDGSTTKINETGPHLSDHEFEELLATIENAYDHSVTWVAACGSLPPGMPEDIYAQLTTRIHAKGGKIAIDSSGPALAAAINAGPDLIKPNRVELSELIGKDLPDLGSVVAAARSLINSGVGSVLVSLGKDGAAYITADSLTHASAHVEHPVSTVAAGDCTLAGFLLAMSEGLSGPEALLRAVAFGAAAVALPGSEIPTAEQVAAIQPILTQNPDLTLPLTD
ncbi:Tagatose-6-phosphate kinase [Dermatophilus congolensis]|uniref:1-phosphofructokinase n=1 Tax=Dermatophilus congolensis TaxID=1863 RepID=A0A239VJT3_9MICO|nr:1-phosphofructokinase [Dermatophilus congolensis]SNV22551.1 Tagatose-6-phosphate kinase [Dermatophilus congolensis]